MLPGCWLLAALLLAPGSRGAPGPSCEDGAPRAGCGAPPDSAKAAWEACAERGCGRALGEPCGVYTPSCARGLRCIPRAGERAPLHALLHGKGVCRAVGGRKGGRNPPGPEPPAGESRKENRRPSHPTLEPLSPQHHGPLTETNGSKDRLHQISLNSEGKPDLETAPCRMHLAAVMLELKAPLYLSGEDIFIPNCDTKGFYRKKQCRASKGQKRGQCWCVDKKGHPLAGSGGLEGNPHCLPNGSD
ncbi:insulin-like growth factor-binding protein 6 [Carettochelys insculpta]|uniref:insulin-like growth factor-binding protein 6 n=1 Tax=Carettochelys insculpta TaxID=44489 RepID=UPI003EBC6C18